MSGNTYLHSRLGGNVPRGVLLLIVIGWCSSAMGYIETLVPASFCYTSSQNISCLPTIKDAALSACDTVGAGNSMIITSHPPVSVGPYWPTSFATASCLYWNFDIAGRGNCPSGYNYNPSTTLCERTVQQCTPPNVPDPATSRCVLPTCTAPDTLDPGTGKCTPPKTYTLTLEGSNTVAPASSMSQVATVRDQNGIAQNNKPVTITLDVQESSGGHIHTGNRPKGGLSCASNFMSTATCTVNTDYRGQILFDFFSTPISGVHTLTATCSGCVNTETKSISVKVSGLIPIPGSDSYSLSDSRGQVIGAVPGRHTANHYLTSVSISKLDALAKIYVDLNPSGKLYLNDASLEWGGLFDVSVNAPWSSPHSTHDKGRSLDIRAENSGPNNEGAVPAKDFKDLIKEARKKGFRLGLHCKNSTDTVYCLGQPNNRHFHVDF